MRCMHVSLCNIKMVNDATTHAIGNDTEPQWPPFCQPTGPQSSVQDATAEQCFSEVFTPGVWDLLVAETNRYAHYRLRNPPSHHGILHNWRDTGVRGVGDSPVGVTPGHSHLRAE